MTTAPQVYPWRKSPSHSPGHARSDVDVRAPSPAHTQATRVTGTGTCTRRRVRTRRGRTTRRLTLLFGRPGRIHNGAQLHPPRWLSLPARRTGPPTLPERSKKKGSLFTVPGVPCSRDASAVLLTSLLLPSDRRRKNSGVAPCTFVRASVRETVGARDGVVTFRGRNPQLVCGLARRGHDTTRAPHEVTWRGRGRRRVGPVVKRPAGRRSRDAAAYLSPRPCRCYSIPRGRMQKKGRQKKL